MGGHSFSPAAVRPRRWPGPPRLAVLLWTALAAVLLPAAAWPALAQDVRARIVRYGELRGERAAGERDPTLRSDTLSGVVPMASSRIVREGARIPGRYCEGFGIEFEVAGVPPGESVVLLVRNRHPRMRRPDGAESEEDFFEIRVSSGPSFVGFTFAESWSLIPGRWSFALLHRGRVLAEQGFDVERAPDAGSLEANGCAVPVS